MRRISLLVAACAVLNAVNAHGDGMSYTVPCQGSNDTAAFTTAFATIVCPAGGELIIPPGTCMVSASGLPFSVCSNLTIRGVGRKSVLKILPGSGPYASIFGPPVSGDAVSNLVIKDFTVDQSPSVSVGAGLEQLHVINIRVVPATFHGVSGIAVSGMFFDPTDATHTIHVENDGVVTAANDGNLRATITNNYFNFMKTGASTYANSAVYLEGSQQVVTGNTFFSTLNPVPAAGTAVETHGGRSSISNNTANNYATFANVVPTASGISTALSPNNIAVANNSITCVQNGIILSGISGRILQNVSVAGNTIQVCNGMRFAQTNPPNFAGIVWNGTAGDLDGLEVSNNIISMDPQPNTSQYAGNGSNNGGILLYTPGNFFDVLVTGNIVTNSPFAGIRVGSSSTSTPPPVQRVRVNDNIIVDAGNDNSFTPPSADAVYRHAIGLWGTAKEVDLMRNMIYDTGNPSNGLYSLYLNPTALSTNIRTSQNTVRGAATTLPVLRAYQNPNTVGLVDATNANDLNILQIIAGSTGTPAVMNVDFMSFTRYITTIADNGLGGQQVIKLLPPAGDSSGVQWTVGQLVTFRFRCQSNNSCLVQFDPQTSPNVSAYSTTGDLAIPANAGRAITFEVESLSTGSTTRKFFELYRTPAGGVSN